MRSISGVHEPCGSPPFGHPCYETRVMRNDGPGLLRDDPDEGEAEGGAREEIARLEARIERRVETAQRCRKIIMASKLAMAAGGILIVAMMLGLLGFDPSVMIGSLSAVIGGI